MKLERRSERTQSIIDGATELIGIVAILALMLAGTAILFAVTP